jgi:3-oxoadipate enol-lactonase
MPRTTSDAVDLFYETMGSGETVAFIGEAGYGAWQWGWHHDAITGPYEALVWDLRGTGKSGAPEGPYSVEAMAADLEAVLAAAEARRAHLVGAGLGGMIALQHASEYGRAASLTLFGTAPSGDDIARDVLQSLWAPGDDRHTLRESLAPAFSEDFLEANSDVVDQICTWRSEEDAGSDAFDAQTAAMRDFDAPELFEITLPALVCHGIDDPVIQVEVGEALASSLPLGVFEPVAGKHLCHVEHSRAVSDRLLAFLDDLTESADST